MDIFKKVFNGDERLVITFWVWGFVGSIVYGFTLGLVLVILGMASTLIISLLQLPWFAFIWISIWRSAGKYKGPQHWALIAKILVGLGVVYWVYGLIFPTPMPTF